MITQNSLSDDMKKELQLVESFHRKFDALVSDQPSLIAEDRARNRHSLMAAEVHEYLDGVEKGDIENIAKELADILYTVYGTIVEHGLQDKMPAIFEAVHLSNMSKDYHPYKMIKGDSYFEADVASILTR